MFCQCILPQMTTYDYSDGLYTIYISTILWNEFTLYHILITPLVFSNSSYKTPHKNKTGSTHPM